MKGKEAFKSADIRDGRFIGYIKGDLNLDIARIEWQLGMGLGSCAIWGYLSYIIVIYIMSKSG